MYSIILITRYYSFGGLSNMLCPKQLTISQYSSLYREIIPKEHILRKISENIDFSFVNKMVKENYCECFGRPADEPEMMFKLLFLQFWKDLSDREVIEEAKYNMAFKYFLGLNPEDSIVDFSMLSKFRKLRINGEDMLQEMLMETVHQAIQKGILFSNSIIVDATHCKSKSNIESPTQRLRRLSKNLRKEVYRIDFSLKDEFPEKPTHESSFEEELAYTKQLIEVIEKKKLDNKNIFKQLDYIKQTLETQEIEKIQSVIDEDAKIGYKSPEESFFGYKTHFAMTTEERIITAVEVTSGEAPDGHELENLIEKTKENGVDVKETIGDKAYSSKDNLDYMYENEILPITKMLEITSTGKNIERNGFTFNKDAGLMVCPAGHLAMSVEKVKPRNKKNSGNANGGLKYNFSIRKCKNCPYKEGCYKEGLKTKTYTVNLGSETSKKHEEFQETEYFKARIKERYKIEAKNSELKGSHGLGKCRYSRLKGMQFQSYMTAFVVNVKRIIKMIDPKSLSFA